MLGELANLTNLWYSFRSPCSNVDIMAIVSNRIARALPESVATLTVALDMPKVLGHSKLISSMGPTDRNFRENKKIIILISSQNKK